MRDLRALRVGVRSLVLLGLLLMAGVAAAGVDVTGKWVLSVDLDNGQGGDAAFEFQQDGDQLTGSYSGALGEAEVTGKVDGEKIEFSFEGQQVGTVTYQGEVSGAAMEGTCEYGGFASGTFKGEKKEE